MVLHGVREDLTAVSYHLFRFVESGQQPQTCIPFGAACFVRAETKRRMAFLHLGEEDRNLEVMAQVEVCYTFSKY